MAYDIDEDITVGDTGHVEHHEALATAVNDLDTRALKAYVSRAELDAETEPGIGILTLDDTATAFPELSDYAGNEQSKLVIITSVLDYPIDEDDSPGVGGYRLLVQSCVIVHATAGNTSVSLHRKAIYDSTSDTIVAPYEFWTASINIRPNNTEDRGIATFVPESSGGGLIPIHTPAVGTWTFKSVDGTMQWVED